MTVSAPEQPGVYYLYVLADKDDDVGDPSRWNNAGFAAGALAVDLPALSVQDPVTGEASRNQWRYFRLDATPGNTLLLTREAMGVSGQSGLYVRYGAPPTLDEYDDRVTGSNLEEQQLRILSPMDGTYYVGLYMTSGADGAFTVSAERTELEIARVEADRVGNAGSATVLVEGDNFAPDAQVRIEGDDDKVVEADVYYESPAALYATFPLADANAAAGAYDVVVVNLADGEQVKLPGALSVVDGGEAEFNASLSMPGSTRPGRVMDVLVEYGNTGLIDVSAPVLTFTSNHDDCKWMIPGTEDWVERKVFRLLGLSSTGPVTVLRPGQTETLVIPLTVPFRPEPVTISLFSMGATPTDGSNTPIDWVKFEEDVRSARMCDERWNPALANLQEQIGPNWGD